MPGSKNVAMDEESIRIVRAQPLFSGLDDELFNTIIQGAHVRTFPKGRVLFQRGDPAECFFVILDGWVKIYRDTVNGDQAILGIFSRGDMFAEAAAFIGVGFPASAEVVEDARLVGIESKKFAALVEKLLHMAIILLASHVASSFSSGLRSRAVEDPFRQPASGGISVAPLSGHGRAVRDHAAL